MSGNLDGIDALKMTYNLGYQRDKLGNRPKQSSRRKNRSEKSDKFLKDTTITIDLLVGRVEKVKERTITGKIRSLFGYGLIKEDFDANLISEIIIRDLKRIKYKNVVALLLNEKELYNRANKWDDIEEVLKLSRKQGEGIITIKTLYFEMKNFYDDQVQLYVSPIHTSKSHSITIQFQKISKKHLSILVKYLEKHLEISRLISK